MISSFAVIPADLKNEIYSAYNLFNDAASIKREIITSELTLNIDKFIEEHGLIADGLSLESEKKELETYFFTVLNQPSSAAAKRINRPKPILEDSQNDPLAEKKRKLRNAYVQFYQVKALKLFLENCDPQPFRNFKNLFLKEQMYNWRLKVHCPICNELGGYNINQFEITREEKNLLLSGRFYCEKCTHCFVEHRAKGYSINAPNYSQDCECTACGQHEMNLNNLFLNGLKKRSTNILQKYKEWAHAHADNDQKIVTEKEMWRDYESQKNNLSKDLRAVLSLKPENYEDFLYCAQKYYGEHYNSYRINDQIFRDAIRYKVLYSVSSYSFPTCEKIHDLFHTCFDGTAIHKPMSKRLDKSQKEIFEDLIAEMFNDECVSKKLININPYHVSYKSGDILICLRLDKEINSSNFENTEYIINPNFLKVVNENKVVSNSIVAIDLFKSATEYKAYCRIIDENKDCIVVPNRKLYQIIKIKDLEEFFQKDDYKYLWRCEIDMAVYDSEGKLLFVEEIQRGQHHNTHEWKRRDFLKREALRYAGVTLKESF